MRIYTCTHKIYTNTHAYIHTHLYICMVYSMYIIISQRFYSFKSSECTFCTSVTVIMFLLKMRGITSGHLSSMLKVVILKYAALWLYQLWKGLVNMGKIMCQLNIHIWILVHYLIFLHRKYKLFTIFIELYLNESLWV